MDGIHVHAELGFCTANTQRIIRDPEILCFHHRGRRFRFSGADGLEYHIVRKSALFSGYIFFRLDGVGRFRLHGCRIWNLWYRQNRLRRQLGFLFFHQSSDKGYGFRPEDRKAGGILEGNVLEVDRAKLQIYTVNQECSAVDLKGGFPGDQMLTGKFLVRQGRFFCRWSDDGDSLIDIGNVSFVHVPLKKSTLHADGILSQNTGHGVPYIIFIHMVDYEMYFRIAVERSCQLIAGTIYFSILGGKNQSFGQSMLPLHFVEELDSVILFCKPEELSVLAIVFLNSTIEDTGNTTFIGEQTDRESVGICFCGFFLGNGFHILHDLLDKG